MCCKSREKRVLLQNLNLAYKSAECQTLFCLSLPGYNEWSASIWQFEIHLIRCSSILSFFFFNLYRNWFQVNTYNTSKKCNWSWVLALISAISLGNFLWLWDLRDFLNHLSNASKRTYHSRQNLQVQFRHQDWEFSNATSHCSVKTRHSSSSSGSILLLNLYLKLLASKQNSKIHPTIRQWFYKETT